MSIRAAPSRAGEWRSATRPLLAPEERGPAPSAQRPSILIVEDEHLVAIEIEGALLDAGFDVAGIAATAEEAVALAKDAEPTLAIMDMRLAGKRDGIDAALELFREFGIRCIFATAHHDPGTRRRAQQAQPFGWVAKPYQADTLTRAVREALRELEGE